MSPLTSVTSIVETDRKTMEEMGMTTVKTRHFNVVMFGHLEHILRANTRFSRTSPIMPWLKSNLYKSLPTIAIQWSPTLLSACPRERPVYANEQVGHLLEYLSTGSSWLGVAGARIDKKNNNMN
ncbi:hypothetical protein BgiMline_013485 [Biomphalaria glabrata]